MKNFARFPLLLAASLFLLTGCPGSSPNTGGGKAQNTPFDPNGPQVRRLEFNDPVNVHPDETGSAVTLLSARNETISFCLQIDRLTHKAPKAAILLHLQRLRMEAEQIAPALYEAYQILPMPVDTNRAGFVRHTGLAAGARQLPRALLPIPVNTDSIALTSLRNPAQPQSPAASPVDAAQLWFDLTVPPTAKPGLYTGAVDVQVAGQIVSSIPVQLTVYDFVIPDERHLAMVGRLNWERLITHYETLFGTATPELMSRKDPKYADAIKVLDQVVALGQKHRAQIIVPNLQPQVKWPPGKPPQIDWEDFDSVALPWLKGDAFADKVPIGYWPLPAAQYVFNFNAQARGQYWAAAASHFDQLDLLAHAPLVLDKRTPGPIRPADAIELSQEAARLMDVHPNVQIALPLEDDQLDFQKAGGPGLDPDKSRRLLTTGAGIVFAAPANPWPQNVQHPPHLLRTDLPGLIPYAGAGGDDRDVRLWAWLAFLRNAVVVQWDNVLPSYKTPEQPADPNEVVWFYPGNWFGMDEPVPTVQLKWLRRAAFDYEYLLLASQRGEKIAAIVMARCITKPVQTERQSPDPTYALMTGTTDAQAWESARQLLARRIVARVPGQKEDESTKEILTQITGEMLQWTTALEKPLLLGRTTNWGWSANKPNGNWVDLKLGLDIYNAAGVRLIGNLRWAAVPDGSAWEISPQPVEIPPNQSIGTFNVRRYDMDAYANLAGLNPQTRQPIDLVFANDLGGRDIVLRVVCPIAESEKLEGAGRVNLDGKLNEWTEVDALHTGKLVQMLSRPSLQQQELRLATTSSQVYSGWAAQNFYVAFKVEGLGGSSGRSFLDYQFRRAWGEDLVQMLVQPIYASNVVGPVLHLACKPSGQVEVESKANAQFNANPWQTIVGANVRYASTQEGNTWRGEVAIPWAAINDEEHKNVRPTLLRFNFVQHTNTTGESASWAGPLDYGRDDAFMGLLRLHDPAATGNGGKVYEQR